MGQAYTGNYDDFDNFDEILNVMASSGMLGTKYIFQARNGRRPISIESRKDIGDDIRVKCFDEYLEIANNIINENKDLIEFLFDKLKKSQHIGPDEMRIFISEFNSNN